MLVDKNEVLRYLGYKKGRTNLDEAVLQDLDYYIPLGVSLLQPDATYRIYGIARRAPQEIFLADTDLTLTGQHIVRHLAGAVKVCLLAATIGPRLEAKVEELFREGLYAAATILDAVGSTAVESVADQLQEQFQVKANKDGYQITWRFGTGYGDLPLELQPQLGDASGATNIGVTVTKSCMLQPRKSIIGIIGLVPYVLKTVGENKCQLCANDCDYRKQGEYNE